MKLLDGKTPAQSLLTSLKFLPKTSLHVILVGRDPSSVKYVSIKEKKCREFGIDFQLHHLPRNTSAQKILNLISGLNQNPNVTGFFIQLPLPSHLDQQAIVKAISPLKDVDGLNPDSNFSPAVVVGIIKLLDNYRIGLKNKNVVIVNDSDLIGQPLKKEIEAGGGLVTLCNQQTSNLRLVTQDADILISAAGVKNLITPDFVADGAVVVDVAGGDVEFENVSPKCSYITPTFGGVGPMTVACLLYNLSRLTIP